MLHNCSFTHWLVIGPFVHIQKISYQILSTFSVPILHVHILERVGLDGYHVSNVPHQWFPLGQSQTWKIPQCCGRAPINMIPYSFCPFWSFHNPFPCLLWAFFFTMPLIACHWSKKCLIAGCELRIYLQIPLWRSDTKSGIVKPAVVIKNSKHLLHPCNSTALLLPDWFA